MVQYWGRWGGLRGATLKYTSNRSRFPILEKQKRESAFLSTHSYGGRGAVPITLKLKNINMGETNIKGRTMKPRAYEEVKIKRADAIFEQFQNFTNGYRCLFLIQRHKEGGETNNSKLIKKITNGPDEFATALLELVSEKMDSKLSLRIYSCVNARDFDKAIRKFKYEQLDADFYDKEQRNNFYLDIKNRFIGCLMQPTQKAESLFLFDIDNEEGRDVCGEVLKVLPNEYIEFQYPTKNGWHIVTRPFNHTKITLPKGCELKKDALLLLDY